MGREHGLFIPGNFPWLIAEILSVFTAVNGSAFIQSQSYHPGFVAAAGYIFVGWAAFSSAHEYLPLAVLGVFYGIMLSYPATKILGPKLQSALGGLLGGVSLGNLSNKVATGTSAIRSVSQFINNSVQQILGTFPGISKSQYLEDGVVLCIWMALITMFLVIGINAYYQGEIPKDAVAATVSVVAHEPIHPIAQEHAAGG